MENENSRLRKIRLALDVSQDKFCESLGLARSGLSAIETGQRKVSDKHIKMLKASYPTINEDWLRTGEGEMLFTSVPSVEDITNGAILDEMDTKIIQCYLNLSTDDRQVIKKYLVSLLEQEEPEISEEERMEAEIQEELKILEAELRAEKRAKAKSSDLDELLQA